jgi:hypothetical protein
MKKWIIMGFIVVVLALLPWIIQMLGPVHRMHPDYAGRNVHGHYIWEKDHVH